MERVGWKCTLLIFCAAVVFLWLVKAPIFSAYLSSKMGISVSVRNMSVFPTVTEIDDFRIGNPRGFKTRTAFKADSIDTHYNWQELKSDPSVIQEMFMEEIFLGIELANEMGTENNWTKILSGMKSKGDKKVILRKLVLTNVVVEIRQSGSNGATETRTIDRMEFQDIESNVGFPTGILIERVFEAAGLGEYIEGGSEAPAY